MKKILAFLTMALLVFGIAAGVTASENQGNVLELTLEESIEKALNSEANYDLRRAEIDVEKAENGVYGALTLLSYTQGVVAADAYMSQSLKDDKVYKAEKDVAMAQVGMETARKAEELKKTSSKLAVEKQYYEVLKASRKVENLLAKVETSQQLIRQAEVKFKAGTVAKKDIMDAEVQYAMDRANLAKGQRDKEVTILQFKRLIGLDLDTQIKLVSNFMFKPKEVYSLLDLVEDAQDKSFDIFVAKEKIEAYDHLLQKGINKNWTSTSTHSDIIFSRDEAVLAQKSEERDAELAAYQANSLLLGAEDQLKFLDKRVEQAKEGLRLTKLQYQAGLTTSLMVNQAGNALAEVQAASLEALYNYNVIKAMLDNGIYNIPGAATL